VPNWCSNRLAIQGGPEAVEKWLAEVGGTDATGAPLPLDFERVLPTPAEFAAGRVRSTQAEELLSHYFASETLERQRLARAQPLLAMMANDVAVGRPVDEVTFWDASDWRAHNWGTKWPAAADSFRLEEPNASGEHVVMRFSTASSAPRSLVLELVRRYPTLSFDLVYSEPDGGFAGRLSAARGEVEVDEETREPGEAVGLLAEAGWADAADDWREPDDADS
jgi:hypothetical protein